MGAPCGTKTQSASRLLAFSLWVFPSGEREALEHLPAGQRMRIVTSSEAVRSQLMQSACCIRWRVKLHAGKLMSDKNRRQELPSFGRQSRYIVPAEVEKVLAISPATRRRWTNRGLLRAYPIGPFYRPGPSVDQEGRRNGSRVRYLEEEVNDLAERIRNGDFTRTQKPHNE
jgi:hypothetical protein